MQQNRACITGTAATIATLLQASALQNAAEPLIEVLKSAEKAFGKATADRIFYYNPDAIASWLVQKRKIDFAPLQAATDLQLPLCSVVPPVTPVCFASMYSGLQPAEHGIQRYEKPVLRVPTIFDTLPVSGKKIAIVSTAGDSISKIFLGRPVDYFIYDTVKECNAKAFELIEKDAYSVIVLYNGNYDHWMHRCGPEGPLAKRALKQNLATFGALKAQIAEKWTSHDTVLAFAPDHGCHKMFGLLGTHGIDAPSDMEITHFYSFLPKSK